MRRPKLSDDEKRAGLALLTVKNTYFRCSFLIISSDWVSPCSFLIPPVPSSHASKKPGNNSIMSLYKARQNDSAFNFRSLKSHRISVSSIDGEDVSKLV